LELTPFGKSVPGFLEAAGFAGPAGFAGVARFTGFFRGEPGLAGAAEGAASFASVTGFRSGLMLIGFAGAVGVAGAAIVRVISEKRRGRRSFIVLIGDVIWLWGWVAKVDFR
jgi:hypothetical protein